jgi:hypothetical protein
VTGDTSGMELLPGKHEKQTALAEHGQASNNSVPLEAIRGGNQCPLLGMVPSRHHFINKNVLIHGSAKHPDFRRLELMPLISAAMERSSLAAGALIDGQTYEEKMRMTVPAGPGMQIFSPDGKYGYVCSSFNPETDVISVADHKVVGKVTQASPFCTDIAATPDGKQVWLTLKDVGKTEVFDAQPPFSVLKVLNTGPITNHVNIVHNAHGTFACLSDIDTV